MANLRAVGNVAEECGVLLLAHSIDCKIKMPFLSKIIHFTGATHSTVCTPTTGVSSRTFVDDHKRQGLLVQRTAGGRDGCKLVTDTTGPTRSAAVRSCRSPFCQWGLPRVHHGAATYLLDSHQMPTGSLLHIESRDHHQLVDFHSFCGSPRH